MSELSYFLRYKKKADDAEKQLSQPMINYLNELGIYDLQGLKAALKINKDNVPDIKRRAKEKYNLVQSGLSDSDAFSSDKDADIENMSVEYALEDKADTQSGSSYNQAQADANLDLQTDPTYDLDISAADQDASAHNDSASNKNRTVASGMLNSTVDSNVSNTSVRSSEASNVRLSDIISSHTSNFTSYPVKKHWYGHVNSNDLSPSCSKVMPKLLTFLHKTNMIDNFWVNLMCKKLHVYRKTVLRTLQYLQKKGYVSKPNRFGHRNSYYGDMRYQQP